MNNEFANGIEDHYVQHNPKFPGMVNSCETCAECSEEIHRE